MAKTTGNPTFENDYDIFAVGGERVELAGMASDVYALTGYEEAELVPDPEDLAIRAASDIIVTRMLDSLNLRAQYIMEERYGFGGGEATLEEVGDTLGLTKERVRQIQAESLARLRSSDLVRELARFRGYEPGQTLPFGFGRQRIV